MLETLRIQNYALIDAVEMDFRSGFNALTGETGAGKSILIGALELVLGSRASGEVLREGADRATIEAVFRVPRPSPRLKHLLKGNEIDATDGEVLLSRVMTADGRSRGYVCGRLMPFAVLSEIGDELVDLHGQHEHQSLLRPDRQLELLDAFASTEEDAAAMAERVESLRAMDRELAALETDDRERLRQIEFFRFEVNEIDAAALTAGEEEDVRGRVKLITNAETVFTLANRVYALLYENEGQTAIDLIDAAVRELEELAGFDERYRALATQLTDIRAGVESVANETRAHVNGLEFDAQELDRLNARLALLRDLKRKYGATVEEILAHRDQAAAHITAYEQRDERLAALRGKRDALHAETQSAAAALSRKRAAAAQRLNKKITETLQELGMKGGSFEACIERVPLCAQGVDRVEFLLAANPGERLKPLRQVASGGEISRIMLALKAVFAGADRIPTLVFDEIDAGVGGAMARKVADKIGELARSHQVICITHIPQIAALARTHFRVAKETKQKRTTSSVVEVSGEARVAELARLLDGTMSDVSLEHARALLRER